MNKPKDKNGIELNVGDGVLVRMKVDRFHGDNCIYIFSRDFAMAYTPVVESCLVEKMLPQGMTFAEAMVALRKSSCIRRRSWNEDVKLGFFIDRTCAGVEVGSHIVRFTGHMIHGKWEADLAQTSATDWEIC